MKRTLLILIFFSLFVHCTSSEIQLRIKTSQGGLFDVRAEGNSLGGGQLALDIGLNDFPFYLSYSEEYYKKGVEAVYDYEIDQSSTLYIYYKVPFCKTGSDFFYFGPGITVLLVPQNNPDKMAKGLAVNSSVGFNIKLLWKIDFYAETKYLYTPKIEKGNYTLSFNDPGLLLGFNLSFNIRI